MPLQDQAPKSTAAAQFTRHAVARQRQLLLARLHRWTSGPMSVLGLVWLALLVVDFWRGLGPVLQSTSHAIWAFFVAVFVLEWALAPRKWAYLRTHWLTVLSLAIPAVRVLRFARASRLLATVRVGRGLRLLRVLSATNRGLKSLGVHMGRRGLPYVLALTALVTLAGGAGMYALERDAPGGGLNDFGTALWWTAMVMTTMGSEYWPKSPEGRLLCLALAVYAFSVFGYVTASLASYFVGRDGGGDRQSERLEAALEELRVLRRELAQKRPDGA